VAVEAFVNRRLGFCQISEIVARTMARHQNMAKPTLEQIIEADAWARAAALK
jgi:1-deoxy-D-xylulose-5-phosphate reductoisomerase